MKTGTAVKIFVVFFSLALLVACKREKTNQFVAGADVLTDSIVLENINANSRINFYPNDTDLLVSYISDSKDKIILYSVAHRKAVDSVRYDTRDMGDQYYVDEFKNTYVIKRDQAAILRRDSLGNEKYLYAKPEVIYLDKDSNTVLYSPISVALQIIDSTIVLNNNRGYRFWDERERSLYYRSKDLAFFKLENDSLVKKTDFGAFPKFYHNNYIDEMWPVAARVSRDRIFYIFSNDNVLFDENIPDGKITLRKIKGLDRNKTIPFDVRRMTELAYSNDYQIRNTSYIAMLYDRITGESAIFQMLPATEQKNAESLYIYFDKPMVVNVMDTAFNVYKKVYFPDLHKFFIEYSCMYKNKLYALERYENTNKSTVKVYVYKIK